MSTIERVGQLLGLGHPTQQKTAAPTVGAGNLDPNLIERAAGDIGRQQGISAHRHSRTATSAARTLKVDRRLLRQQSIIVPDGDRTAITESFRHVKRKILAGAGGARSGGAPANLVLVTSALPGEGKTFCAINLAISVALEKDRTVLLVDADVVKPSIPQALGLTAHKGLMDILLDRHVELADVLLKTDIGGLTLLPVGESHQQATELLASDAMRRLLHELAERYHDRIIIFDSPPLLAASEAGVLAGQMGQTIVVVEAGKTSEAALKEALGRIDSTNVVGLLLNKGEDSGLRYGYGGYGYGSR